MSTVHRIALLGFSAFERNTLGSYFRLASTREPRYEQVQLLPEADFVIADADDEPAVKLVLAVERLPEAVFVGARAPEGAIAWLPRPIDPMRVLRELDVMAARRMSQPGAAVRTDSAADAARRRTVIQPVRPRRPEAPAELLTPATEVLDLTLPDLPEPPRPPALATLPANLPANLPAGLPESEPSVVTLPAVWTVRAAPLQARTAAPRAQATSPQAAPQDPRTAAPSAASTPVPAPAARAVASMPAAAAKAASAPRPPGALEPTPSTATAASAATVASAASAASAASTVPAARAPASTGAALLVDDSALAQRFLQKKLAPFGLHTDCAAHSEAAMKLLAERRYDFVFLDIELGERSTLDGLSLCQRIKERAAASNVVMVTAHHTELDRVRGALAGCDGFLGKPLDEGELALYLARFGVRPAANAGRAPS